MARYLITYLDEAAEIISAEKIECPPGQYIAYEAGEAVAYVPAGNVLSIVRQAAADGVAG